MIALTTRGRPSNIVEEIVGRVALEPVPHDRQRETVLALRGQHVVGALSDYLAVITPCDNEDRADGVPVVARCRTDHLDADDVVSINPTGEVRTVYRRQSRSNSLFATERCNSFCVMCSQPPREVDDTGRVAHLIRILTLIHPETKELGITGGEPTLLGDGLLDVIRTCRDRLPTTAVHLLSNGRRFRDIEYAAALGAIKHPDLMVGVPVYSDLADRHDFVVQARGAFEETIRGLHNLAFHDVPVEIRVVIHAETRNRLPQLAGFIIRNLPFAVHVAFMGLEVIGFAKANIASLWSDPLDYAQDLEQAVLTLASGAMNVSVYNHQLCTLPQSLHRFSRQSISDWKNEYALECAPCRLRSSCGGFFAWNLAGHKSRGIHPIV